MTQFQWVIHDQIRQGGRGRLGACGAVAELGHDPGPPMPHSSTQKYGQTFLNALKTAMGGTAAPQPATEVAVKSCKRQAAQPEQRLTSAGSQA